MMRWLLPFPFALPPEQDFSQVTPVVNVVISIMLLIFQLKLHVHQEQVQINGFMLEKQLPEPIDGSGSLYVYVQ